MKRYCGLALVFGVVLLCGSGAVDAAVCAPKTLVHIVVTAVTPGIDPASVAAQEPQPRRRTVNTAVPIMSVANRARAATVKVLTLQKVVV